MQGCERRPERVELAGMEKRICPGCGVACSKNLICINCCNPQERQEIFERGLAEQQALALTLRDKFAMRVLPTLIHEFHEDGTGFVVACDKHFTDASYEWADLMLDSRKKPLPESG